MPKIYKKLYQIRNKLENHYTDMQDIEFTIQDHKLYMLQTRTGKRTGLAAIRIAIDMVEEGLIDEKMAMLLDRKAKVIAAVTDGADVPQQSMLSELINEYLN